MNDNQKTKSRGPRNCIGLMAETLIRKAELTDEEMCNKIKEKYPKANTSIKCIQYYRYQMRQAGKIPPAKINHRKTKTILMWELIPGIKAVPQENLEGQYTGKALIKKCREVMRERYNVSKQEAWEELYSVPTCALFLRTLGWECIEFQTTVKTNEYIKE